MKTCFAKIEPRSVHHGGVRCLLNTIKAPSFIIKFSLCFTTERGLRGYLMRRFFEAFGPAFRPTELPAVVRKQNIIAGPVCLAIRRALGQSVSRTSTGKVVHSCNDWLRSESSSSSVSSPASKKSAPLPSFPWTSCQNELQRKAFNSICDRSSYRARYEWQ